MALAIIGKNLSRFGFDNIEFERALDFEEITVPANTDLYKAAEVLGLEFKDVKKYNPELLRWQTPPHRGEYVLRVPVGKKIAWESFENKDFVVASDYKTYKLNGYASLYHVGRKFKVKGKVLSELNGFSVNKRLAPKTIIKLPFRADHRARKHRLYTDLYERPRKSVVRRRTYQRWIKRGKKKGSNISNPSQYYTVKSGDTLWAIAKRTGVNINTIIRSNYRLVKKRMILPGDKLAIR
jgi:membrane-bound lytic murein transglycosylase D